jgi:HAD superfamily hydrolase (TIGR01549 family)
MVPVAAAIFDLDQTLLDTDALRHEREQRAWGSVSKKLATVKPFQFSHFGEIEVVELVEEARARGLKVGVLTQTPEWYASELLRQHGIRVDLTISGSDKYPPKPDSAGLRAMASGLGVSPKESLYIGDSMEDFWAAAAAGMVSIGVAWSRRAPLSWHHAWPDIAIDRPATLLRYLDGDRGLSPLAELMSTGHSPTNSPTMHWGSVLRLGNERYALGRYFRGDDQRSTDHGLSQLVLNAKSKPSADVEVAAIFEELAAQARFRRTPELIVSVPPAPHDTRDRFAAARAALASFYGARDGGEALKMSYPVADYKNVPRAARANLNVNRFEAAPISAGQALLIDDILTSGGQSNACRDALRAAGCESVAVITLGMTQDKLPEACPSCGSSLVKRARGTDGSLFFGCTSYPSCRYTRPLPRSRRAQSISASSDEHSS